MSETTDQPDTINLPPNLYPVGYGMMDFKFTNEAEGDMRPIVVFGRRQTVGHLGRWADHPWDADTRPPPPQEPGLIFRDAAALRDIIGVLIGLYAVRYPDQPLPGIEPDHRVHCGLNTQGLMPMMADVHRKIALRRMAGEELE